MDSPTPNQCLNFQALILIKELCVHNFVYKIWFKTLFVCFSYYSSKIAYSPLHQICDKIAYTLHRCTCVILLYQISDDIKLEYES